MWEGDLEIDVELGPGNDTSAINATLDAGSTGSATADLAGGPGDDDLTLNVISVVGDTVAIDAALAGGPGLDTCLATPNVIVTGCEA